VADGLLFIQLFDEAQIGQRLDHFQRVGDATAPEGVPDAVCLIAEVAG
jgi:hypothetical protein